MCLFQKLLATVTKRFWHSRIVREASAKPRDIAVKHKSQDLFICLERKVPWNNYDCVAPDTQTFTPTSTSQSGTLTSSGKVLIHHASSFAHAVLPFFGGICMCNPPHAGWKAAGSIVPTACRLSAANSLSSLPCHHPARRQMPGYSSGQHTALTSTSAVPCCLLLCHSSSTAVQPNNTQPAVFSPLLLKSSPICVTLLLPRPPSFPRTQKLD